MIVTVTLNASIDKAYYLDSPIIDGSVHRVSVVSNSAGGKGLNASRAIATLNYPLCATGFVGGNNGRYLIELAQQDNITCNFTEIKQETRSCINIIEPNRKSTEFLEPGQPVTREEFLAFKTHFSQLINKAEVITFNGSIPKGISARDYKTLITEAQSAKIPCIVDTSGTLLTTCIDALPTMIKPNTDEISQLLGRTISSENDVIQAAQDIHERGVKIVVVSLGSKGALMVSDKGTFKAQTPKIDVVNPVGAGDTLVGSFAVALAQHRTTPKCLVFAMSCATASCLSIGTGRFDPAIAAKIEKQISIQKLP